jgi:hypothetical protein
LFLPTTVTTFFDLKLFAFMHTRNVAASTEPFLGNEMFS